MTVPPLYRGVAKDNSGLGKVAERASGARRKLSRLAGREGRKREKEGKKTSHPRIAHGQRYPMPCLE